MILDKNLSQQNMTILSTLTFLQEAKAMNAISVG